MTFVEVRNQRNQREETLDKAREIATGDRQKHYGSPKDSFQRIANLWSEVFGMEVTPAQVALGLAALKMSRLIGDPQHDDSWVDLAGYAALGSEVAKP